MLAPRIADSRIAQFLEELSLLRARPSETIFVDFCRLSFIAPACAAALISTIHGWMQRGAKVCFRGHAACPCRDYLQRIDFFALSGIVMEEGFRRLSSVGRFVELKRIDGPSDTVERLSTALATCVFPELADSADPDQAGPFDLVQYATSELISNVRQHARGAGFLAAQRYPKNERVLIGIADSGIGIRRSFEENSPPFWDPSMDHMASLRTALVAKASSKSHLNMAYGAPVNAGVGLSILKEMAKIGRGIFTIASGDAVIRVSHYLGRPEQTEVRLKGMMEGTICAFEVPTVAGRSVSQLLHDAKVKLGLLKSDSKIDNLFLE